MNLSGEAEFTINCRTSLLKAPVGAPDRMGSAHAIYNPTDQPVEWMNINVGTSKVYDASDLGDAWVGVAKDPIPQFIIIKLDRADLQPAPQTNGGAGIVLRRRVPAYRVLHPMGLRRSFDCAARRQRRPKQDGRHERGLLCDFRRRQRAGGR